jgi:hypothetical protein
MLIGPSSHIFTRASTLPLPPSATTSLPYPHVCCHCWHLIHATTVGSSPSPPRDRIVSTSIRVLD